MRRTAPVTDYERAEILRLRNEDMDNLTIAVNVGLHESTVQKVICAFIRDGVVERKQSGKIPSSDWTPADLQKLEKLWALKSEKGTPLHSASSIGAMMHRSKDMIVGKARRMGLERRPHAIKGRTPAKPLPERTTNRPSPSVTRLLASPVVEPIPEETTFAPEPPRKHAHDGKGCQWPIGDPRDASFRFCGASVARNRWPRVYCATCADRATRKKTERPEDDWISAPQRVEKAA